MSRPKRFATTGLAIGAITLTACAGSTEVDNWSLSSDLRVVAKTTWAVVTARGAS